MLSLIPYFVLSRIRLIFDTLFILIAMNLITNKFRKLHFSRMDEKSATQCKLHSDGWFAFFIMLMIICFLTPIHSFVVGYDFLSGIVKYVFVAFGLVGFYLLVPSIRKISYSTFTWWALALLVAFHVLFMPVPYPDGMMFPISALIIAGILGWAGSNIIDKSKFLDIIFLGAYVVAIASFMIQIMQLFDVQLMIGNFQLTHLAGNGRLFANLLQPNQLAYVFILTLCAVMYHAYVKKLNPVKKYLLIIVFLLITIGLALTKSRAGFVMAIAVFFIFYFCQPLSIKQKFLSFFSYTIPFVCLYLAVSWMVYYVGVSDYGGSLGAVGRFAEHGNRLNLAKQTLAIFFDHPVFGVGFGNYKSAVLGYLEQFPFTENVDNSHNFLTMILAEMGILGALCLIPIAIMLIKCIHTKHSTVSAASLSFVVATILYSIVEFPLWYFAYLAIFSLFLGLVDQKYLILPNIKNLNVIKQSLAVLLFLSIGIAEYYIWQFTVNRYGDGYRFMLLDLSPSDEDRVSKNMGIFGLKEYNDMILATQTPIENKDTKEKELIFKKAAYKFATQYYLTAYAQMLAYNHQPSESLKYFKIACLRSLDLTSSCNKVADDLKKFTEQNPEVFREIYQQYQLWRQQNPNKTGVVKEAVVSALKE